MSDETTQTLRGLIDSLVGQGLEGLRVSIPGSVTSYDPTTQKADVQPLVKRRRVDGASGELVTERMPVVPAVPVVFPGAGPYAITWPIAVGDVVLLVFADRSLDLWLARGGEVDPEDTRVHSHTDAVAIPGVRPFADPIGPTPPPSDALNVRASKIYLGDPTVPFVEVPGATNEGVVLGSGIDSFTGTPYSLLGSASTKVFAKKT